MIIYNSKMDQRFTDFGIEIPIVDDRSSKVVDALGIASTNTDNFSSITKEDLLLAHTENYISGLFDKDRLELLLMEAYELVRADGTYHRYNPTSAKFPLSELRDRVLMQCGGSHYAMKSALDKGATYFLGGGMHHAMSFGGRGFCLVNDIVIGIRKLQKDKKIKKALVVDVDAHKGDGTAQLCFGDETIYTISLHMKRGWPLDDASEGDPWLIPSDMDVEFDVGEEGSYLTKLAAALKKACEEHEFDLVVIADGADPYEHDELESASLIQLTKEQMLARDLILFDFFKTKKIPQCYLMAGGYGKRSYEIYEQFIKERFL
ncbi:histone deacetylase family protein [Bacteriovorax sp. BSW11_IV]|uniref:histone deacetylase n=1 Tax=Bacteriovorax sp. BSW11_IV TaxID=1353529 RepID=UPI00038A3734|nr:histone deacetylase [Bacteriovorax sp. BSW11_IV]EQC49174.1 histone deacetylase family protein [Bacteriovorax sp. BSW11_IV]